MEFIPGRMYERVGGDSWNFIRGKVYKAATKDRIERDDGTPVLICVKEDFRLIVEDVSRDTKKEYNMYTFQVSSEDAIDHQEIMDTLTRKRPVAIVKRSDGMHTVIIHDSLWNKVSLVDPVLSDKIFEAMDVYWSAGGYISLSSKHLPKVLSLLRELRTAPYVNRKKLTVSVETLEI